MVPSMDYEPKYGRPPEDEPIEMPEAETPIEKAETFEVRVEKASEKNHEQETRERSALDRARRDAELAAASDPVDLGLDATLLGDFSEDDVENGRIKLPEGEVDAVKERIRSLKKSAKFVKPLLGGTPIAAQYDTHVNNFSTHTSIVEMSDGRRLFAVFAHQGSIVHRFLDGIMKHASGLRMGKVSRRHWKDAFLEHARIPQIDSSDPNTVLMPYIENVNAYDIIANNKDIKDFGNVHWASTVTNEGKNDLLRSVVSEINDIHDSGIAWGGMYPS